MSTPNRRRGDDSPCIDICVIHPQAKICVGCFRTGAEIARWAELEPQERRRLMAELPARAALLKKRRGGRRGRRDASPKAGPRS